MQSSTTSDAQTPRCRRFAAMTQRRPTLVVPDLIRNPYLGVRTEKASQCRPTPANLFSISYFLRTCAHPFFLFPAMGIQSN